MFFGKQIEKEVPELLSSSSQPYSTLLLTNAALSKLSQQADLYLAINDQEILICELSRTRGLLHHSLTLMVDLKESPALLSKTGNVHVCGYYQPLDSSHSNHQKINQVLQSATNKKTYYLQSKFQKASTLTTENLSTSLNIGDKNKQPQEKTSSQKLQIFAPRQSSRLSSRRSVTKNCETIKPLSESFSEQKQQRSSKRQKSQSNSSQQKALLSNGRYNLKALLQNIEDDDDQDEESSVAFDENDEDDEDSDDDQDFADDDDDDSEQEKRKPSKKIKRATETESKKDRNNQEKVKPQQKQHKKRQIEVIEQQSSEKVEINTQEIDEKQLQNGQKLHLLEQRIVQKRIEELANKLKVPSIKPTI